MINISHDIKPVTYLKSRAADLLKQINDTRRPVIITQNGEPKAILQDPKSYENMRNAIGILKLISQGENDIRNRNSRSQQKVFDNIESLMENEMKRLYQVIWAHTAEDDLKNIIEYIAGDSPANALSVLKKIKQKALDLYSFPERGRIVPELQDQGILQYRELIISPWRILYRIFGKKRPGLFCSGFTPEH